MRWLSPPDSVPDARDQRQVVEADIAQKAEPLVDLLQDAGGDLALVRGQRLVDAGEPVSGVGDRQRRRLADAPAGDLDRQRLRLEARAVAHLAGLRVLVAPEFLAHPGAVGLAKAPLHVRHDALERPLGRVLLEAVVIGHADRLAARAVKDRAAHPLRQVAPWRARALLEMPRDALERLRVIGRRRMRPGADRTVVQAAAVVVHDEIGIEIELGTEPVAGRAGAERVVEGKQPRLDLGDRKPGHRAGEFRREDRLLAAGRRSRRWRCRRRGRARFRTDRRGGCRDRATHEPIDDDRDVVREILQRRDVVDLVHLAVDLDALKPALLEVAEFLLVLALAARAIGAIR